MLCLIGIVMPATKVGAYSDEPKIENNSKLTSKQAGEIASFICTKINTQYAKSYKLEKYQITFNNVDLDKEKNYVDMDVIFDMTLVDNPKDSAYVKGMEDEVQKTEGRLRG